MSWNFFSLLSSFSDKELDLLQAFMDKLIVEEKCINEIHKLVFDRHFYARFLKGSKFDMDQATKSFKVYLDWRKS